MTLTRAKATEWRNNVESPSAAQLGTLDSNQSKVVDGAAGGKYAPSAPLQINGAGLGSDTLRDIVVDGVLQRASDGRWEKKTTAGEITDVATPQVLDMSNDTYRSEWDHTQNVVIHLAVTTGLVPTEGDMIRVFRENIPTVSKTFKIYSEDTLGTPIAEFPPATGGDQSNEFSFGEFWFNGTTWKAMRLSCDVTD